MRRTPYRIVKADAFNRFDAIDNLSPRSRLLSRPGCAFHPVVLVGPVHRGDTIALATSPGEVTTGAQSVQIQPAMLSRFLRRRSTRSSATALLGGSEKILLKLAPQGYELEALMGLRGHKQTEVILTEIFFFAQAYEPPIAELVAFLHTRAFALYDVGALSARPRDGRARRGDFLFVRRDSALMANVRWS